MYEVKWVKGEVDGRIGLICPYNDEFQSELKALTSSAKFRGSDNAWCFDEELRPLVMPLVERYFTHTAWRRVTMHLRGADNLTVDGARLMYVTRDYWNWRRDTAVNFRVIESNVDSGGSRNNPCVSGFLILYMDIRDGAVISPEPEMVELLEDEQELPNPLANYAIEHLAAELARREATTAAMLKDADLLAELQRRGIELLDKKAIVAAMEAAYTKLYPGPELPEPGDVRPVDVALHKFVKLFRLELEGSHE